MQKRQGDLLVIRIDKLPEGLTPFGSLVLAEGEATGHKHRLDRGEVFAGREGRLYFSTDATATLSHEEHAALSFPPGVYEVRRQREYTPQRVIPVSD